MALQIPGFADHIPDTWANSKKVERPFFWGVLTTLNQDFVVDLLQNIRAQRTARRMTVHAKPANNIQMQEIWMERLLSAPFVPCKSPFPSLKS